MSKNTISVIIPAYNEELSISIVIQTLLNSPIPNEIICINDGSTDNTKEILKQFENHITIINLKKNQGKGYALSQGIKKAKGNILIFLDADLITLTDKHIQLLLQPILEGKYRGVLGYLAGKTKVNISSNITGQRAYYRKDLIPYIDKIAETRFGVEVFLNSLFPKKDIKKIPLVGLRGLYKYEKEQLSVAISQYLKEGIEIAKVLGNKEVLPNRDFPALRKVSNSIKKSNKKIKKFLP